MATEIGREKVAVDDDFQRRFGDEENLAFESAARSKPKGRTRSGSKRVLRRFGFVKSVAATISSGSTRSPNVS